jgi:nitronate monooxygenase
VVAGENAKRLYEEGELDLGVIACGQSVGLGHDVPMVRELFERIMGEAVDTVDKLTGR